MILVLRRLLHSQVLFLGVEGDLSLSLVLDLLFWMALRFLGKRALFLRVKFYTTFLLLFLRAFVFSSLSGGWSLRKRANWSNHRARCLGSWSRCSGKRGSSWPYCLTRRSNTSGTTGSHTRTSERGHTALRTFCVCCTHTRSLGFC